MAKRTRGSRAWRRTVGDANGVSLDPFDRECKIMDRFTENAKSYIQISSGAGGFLQEDVSD